MATVTGRAYNVQLIDSGSGHAIGAEGVAADTALPLHTCFVDIDNNGLVFPAGDTLSTSVPAAIQNSRRDKRTVTVIGVAMAANMVRLSKTLCFKTLAITSGGITTITFIPTEEDYSTTTDAAIAAADVIQRPFKLFCSYTLSASG